MCGGTSKIPRLQKQIGSMFPNGEILSSLSPDEVLALGSASQASLLNENWIDEHVSTEDSKPVRIQLAAINQSVVYTSNIYTCGDSNKGESSSPVTLIPKGTPIPVRRSHHLTEDIGNIVDKIDPILKVTISIMQQSDALIEITTVRYKKSRS